MPTPTHQSTKERTMDEECKEDVHKRGEPPKARSRTRSFIERRKDYNARVVPLPKVKEVIEK